LPNTSLEDAVVVAGRMVEMVKSTPMVWEGQQVGLSISVGVGQYSPDSSISDITKAADQALYAAKQAGKGRVKVFEGVAAT
jgi:diguanylate cyclase (GGDEF)-like protein